MGSGIKGLGAVEADAGGVSGGRERLVQFDEKVPTLRGILLAWDDRAESLAGAEAEALLQGLDGAVRIEPGDSLLNAEGGGGWGEGKEQEEGGEAMPEAAATWKGWARTWAGAGRPHEGIG